MIAPALPRDEDARLAALAACDILDTVPDPDFDAIARLAAKLTECPIALVSLVDRDRQWFKAKVGIEADETPREISFCGHAILVRELTEVEDALADPRFADNPMVLGGPEIRFYAGAPLITEDGHAVGTLCVKDHRPRRLTDEQRDALLGLARQVVTHLELRRRVRDLERETALRKNAERHAIEGRERYWRIFNSSLDAIIAADTRGRITDINPSAESVFGRPREDFIEADAADLLIPQRFRDSFRSGLERAANGNGGGIVGHRMQLVALRGDGTEVPVEATISRTGSEPPSLIAFIRDLTERQRATDARQQVEEELERSREQIQAMTALRDIKERERVEVTDRIRGALAHNGFLLHAQPIVAVDDGSVHANELLVRMRGPSPNGLVMPGQFLPQAEAHHLIGDIDRWVVGQGMRLAATGRVSINLSGASMGDPELLQYIQRLARECGTDPSKVIFEVTETAAVEDLDRARQFVQRLVGSGFGFALDDFGTGFGSFTYVKHLPVNYLKIDMQFTRGMLESEADRRIVRSMIAVARDFGMRTIAEGVEELETLELLSDAGVDFAQGFGLRPPGPLNEVMEERQAA